MRGSLVEQRSKINVSCPSPATTTSASSRRNMDERSAPLLSAAAEAPCRQSDNYRRENVENGTTKVPFSLIVPALRHHSSNSSNSSTIKGNCNDSINNYRSSHVGMTLNLPATIATRKSSKVTVDTTRSVIPTKVKTRLSMLTAGSKRTDETIMHEAMMVELSARTTTSTTYNEFKHNETNKASDHDPNNVVECRIPLVNANNECSRAATMTSSTPSTDVATRLRVIHMAAPSSNLPRKNRCNDDNLRAGKENRNASGFSGGMSVWWHLVVAIYTLLLYISSTSVCWAARQEVISNCSFPQRWEGTWFLSGYQQSVHIRGSQFSYRGKCVASDGNKYLIVNDECHRCLVIYEKHKNVLQFKESECEGDNMYGDQSNPNAMAMRSVVKSDHRGGAHPNLNGHPRLTSSDQYIMRSNDDSNDCSFCKRRETLQNLCDQIPGDALLYSLFRENAEPVKCPLKGPFSFTYNRGHGECKSPVSNIESCTEESRLLLSFQACPDVQGTESTVEELTCLATWKDGNSRYLIGLVSQHHTHHLAAPHHALSNEERYRCFVYEKISTMMGPMSNLNIKDAEYKLAQSGDATCNGLDSAEVGSRMMTLRKPPPAERCDFPAWFKAPRHWRALMGNIGYTFHQSDGSMHITSNGLLETRALCEQINKQTQTEMMAVVHYTRQCESGFMCMTFYKRDMQVAEIQMGTPASRLEDACAPDHFDLNKPFITLLASSPESQLCPLEGLFSLRGAIGPPYITSRHKRNHNNKGHNQHGHHHHEQGHKRHGIQSFRNSEEFGQTSWQSHTRGLSIRSRRAAAPTIPSVENSGVAGAVSMGGRVIDSIRDKSKVFNSRQYRNARPSVSDADTTGNVDSNILDEDSDDVDGLGNTRRITITQTVDGVGHIGMTTQQRNRRDASACMVNYKAQRQLLVGCTDTNLIEVRPRCTEDGEESYLCHGSWTENSTVYIVAKNQATQHGVCISYKQLDGNDGLLVVGDSCYRGLQKPPDHHFVANLTLAGKCGDTSSTHSIHHSKRNWIQLSISTTTTKTTTTLFGIAITCAILVFSTR